MTQAQIAPDPASPPDQARRVRRWPLLLIPLLFIVVRALFAMMNELSADEAYYWVWSRTPSFGYLDHPPMIAWLIAASCALFGSNELAVRLPAILLGGGSILLATYAGHLLGLTRKWLLLLQVIIFCLPMLHVMGTISTPDTPAMFFTLLTLTAGVLCIRTPARWGYWLLLGAAAGLAMQSKYTALLPVAAVLLFLLARSPRQWYRPTLAGLMAVLVLSPLLYWNYERNWISFLFQLRHGTASDDRSWQMNLGDYLGAQLIVATPLLAPLLVWVGAKFTRRSASPGHQLFAITSLLTLLFFGLTSLQHKVEANWPTLAWLPLVVLLASILPTSPHLHRYVRSAVLLAAIFTFVLMLPPSLLSRINKHSPMDKVGGWEQLAVKIRSATGNLPIVCLRYQDASLFSFYLPRQPSVRALQYKGDRRTQFNHLPLPNLGNGFVLVSDRAIAAGERLRLFQGSRAFDVEVVSAQHYATTVDDLTSRSRFAGVCRLVERDATTRPGYITSTP